MAADARDDKGTASSYGQPMPPDDVEFCLIVERGPLEAQALLLCESIRAFAGVHAEARITAISPRPEWRPAKQVVDQLLALGVNFRVEDLISPVAEYGTSYRVLAAGLLGREDGPATIVQLDSDTVFIGEPDLRLGDDLLLARPVDEVGMCSAGPHDPRDAFWESMCRANGVDIEALGWVETSVGGVRVRASFNGGFVAGRRELFAETERVFERIVSSGLRSWPKRRRGERIGAGAVGARGYAWWGTSQAAISIAAARLSGSHRLIDAGHNLPLHLLDSLTHLPKRAVHLHYHWLFENSSEAEAVLERVPGLGAKLPWLRERLPLLPRSVEGIGLFSPQPLKLPSLAKGEGEGPTCSVVMTSYRDTRFLREAVDSVLAQNFTNFELIVVDDGSEDPGPVAALLALDPRIRTIRLDANHGTAKAANRGIRVARGAIIARLDSDDVAEPGWLSRVVGELGADPSLGLVGTAVTLVDEQGEPLGVQPMPESDFAIRFTMLFHNPFYHSTTAYRRELFDAVGGYRVDQPVSQDRYVWFAMLPHARARNLADPLVRYRVNPAGLTMTNGGRDPRARTAPIRAALWREIGIPSPIARLGVADEVDRFLRGHAAADATLRAEAREVVATALDRVEALASDFVSPGETMAAGRFAGSLRQRLAAEKKGSSQSFFGRAIARALKLQPSLAGASLLRRARRRLGGGPHHQTSVGSAPNHVMAALYDVPPYRGFDPTPYPPDLQGWGADDPVFRALIGELRPSLIVEIGSWKGASAIHMASLCREFGLETPIICVDTWLGSSEHVLGMRQDWRESLKARHGFPQIYYTFLANVVRSGFTKTIVPLANTSEVAAIVLREMKLVPDFVYLDASHEEDAVLRDLRAYWPLIRPGGMILGDDFARYPGVRRGAQTFAAEVMIELVDYGDKFVLHRPPSRS